MLNKIKLLSVAASIAIGFAAMPAQANGDLLVAPTRVVLDGSRGTEVILNNVGTEEATYRISLELRRMTSEGGLDEVSEEEANKLEKAALEMIRYAPRRVTLPPNQPQAIRIGVRTSADLPDGEYRAHMLFRAIPKAKPITEQVSDGQGVSIALTPIYGVTIPIIIRKGQLQATAAISNGRIEMTENGPAFAIELARDGGKSVYGEIRVTRDGVGDPLLVARGIAVYPELNGRTVMLPIPPELAEALKGPVKIEYLESADVGGGMIASTRTVLK